MITKKDNLQSCEMFGDYLKYFRTQAGISVTKFGEMVDIYQGNISAIEAGSRKPPSFEVIKRMKKALQLNENETLEFYKFGFYDRLSIEQQQLYDEIRQNFKLLEESNFDNKMVDSNLDEIATMIEDFSPKNYKYLKEMVSIVKDLPSRELNAAVGMLKRFSLDE